ncbi:MAG: hypothetical protein LBF97_03505 [Elusimicrobiota bacterium]|nr:hypothetical protein [Elusimicrobiota bacterium]
MFRLQIIIWIAFTFALALGFIIYFFYGCKHSTFNKIW